MYVSDKPLNTLPANPRNLGYNLLRQVIKLLLFIPFFAHAQFRFVETGGAQTNYIGLQAPAAVTANFTLSLPPSDGTANQCLSTDGAGNLQWRSAGGTGYSLDAVDGSPTNAVYVNAAGNVGIGTTAAVSTLDVNGTLAVGAGSFGAPSYTFRGDLDTGIYNSAANEISVQAGGVQTITSNASNTVIQNTDLYIRHPWNGVYASSSSGLYGPSIAGTYIQSSAFQDNSGMALFMSSVNTAGTQQNAYIATVAQSTGNTPLLVFGQRTGVSSFSERMRINTVGNVGIGTTNPGAALDIGTTGSSSAIIVPRDITANRPTPVNGMLRYNSTTNRLEGYEAGAWVNLSSGLMGKIVYAGATNCAWGNANGSMSNMAADTDCPTPTVSAGATAPGTKIAGLTINNLPPGDYEVTASGQFVLFASSSCRWTMTDGTTKSGAVVGNLGSESQSQFTGIFSYTSAATRTFQIQSANTAAATANQCLLANDEPSMFNFEMWIKRI